MIQKFKSFNFICINRLKTIIFTLLLMILSTILCINGISLILNNFNIDKLNADYADGTVKIYGGTGVSNVSVTNVYYSFKNVGEYYELVCAYNLDDDNAPVSETAIVTATVADGYDFAGWYSSPRTSESSTPDLGTSATLEITGCVANGVHVESIYAYATLSKVNLRVDPQGSNAGGYIAAYASSPGPDTPGEVKKSTPFSLSVNSNTRNTIENLILSYFSSLYDYVDEVNMGSDSNQWAFVSFKNSVDNKSYKKTDYITLTGDTTLTAEWEVANWTVAIKVNNPSYGTVSTTSVSVPYGTTIVANGNILNIGSNKIIATAAKSTNSYTYEFASWTIGSATVTKYTTVTANFSAKEIEKVTFPKTWDTEINSSTYMGSNTISPSTITSIKFKTSATSGYSKKGALSTGIEVYASGTNVEFVWAGVIYAPADCSCLFMESSASSIIFDNFDTSNVTTMQSMFEVVSFVDLDLSMFNTSNVKNMSWMFNDSSSIESINCSGWNTSNVESMQGMFALCSNISELNLSSFNTSNVTNMDEMFYYCSSLSDLIINSTNFNTSNVIYMSEMFRGCSSLNEIPLSGFNTLKVTNMDSMFEGCTLLGAYLDIRNFDMSNVTTAANMFTDCPALKVIKTPSNIKDGVAVALPSGAWYDDNGGSASSLVASGDSQYVAIGYEITAETINGGTVTSTDWSEYNATYTKGTRYTVDSNGNIVSAKLIAPTIERTGYTLKGWYSASSDGSKYTIGSTVSSDVRMWAQWTADTFTIEFNGNGSTSGSTASAQATYNKTVTLSNNGFTRTSYSFSGWATSLTGQVVYLNSATLTTEQVNSMYEIVGKGGTYTLYAVWTQGDVTFPGTWQTEINSSSYMGSNVISPTTITSIKFRTSATSGYSKVGTLSTGVEVYASGTNVEFVWAGVIYAPADCSYLFSNSGSNKLTSLTSISFDNFDTTSVTNMSYMFNGCSRLESLDLSSFNTTYVTSMQSMFEECGAITELNLNGFSNSNTETMERMFFGCKKLNNLNIDNFKTDNVINMSQMFHSCSALTSINVKDFNTSKVTNMMGMFYNCSVLTRLDLSSFNTANVEFMGSYPDYPGYRYSGMFSDCTELQEVIFGNNFKTNKVISMGWMFFNCSKLTNIDLGKFNTSNVTNMRGMFACCSGLTSLDLSSFVTDKVTEIGWMFYKDSELTNLDLSGFDISAVTNCEEMLTDCTSIKVIKLPVAISSDISVSLPTSNGTWYLNDNTTSTTLVATSGTNTAVAIGYTITANANGGSITSGWTTTTIKYSLDSNKNLVAPKLTSLPTAEKTGYTCSGWYLSTDTTTQVTLNTEFNQDTEIIAEWGGDTFTITYNLDGGVVETANPTEYTITTATFTLNNPTKTGYTFTGWTGSNGSTPEKTVTVVNGSTGNLTYTANWLKQQAKPTVVDGLVYNGESQTGVTGTNGEFTLVSGKISAVKAGNYSAIFSLNDGYEWEDGTTADAVINWSIDRISITDFVLSKTSYNFDNTVKTVYVSSITPQDATYDKSGDWSATDVGEYTVTITGNGNYKGTVTKKWQIVENLPATVTITFDSNGGSSVNSQEIAYNSSLSSLPTTTKTGYVLVGWFDSLQNGNEITNETVFTENTTIYAVWEKQQIKVKLNISGQITEITRNYGDALGNLTNPVKDGYTFEGWYKDEAYTQKVESTYMITDENLTLYARFEKITQPIEDNKDNENNNSPIVLIVVLSAIGGVAIIGGVSAVLINKKNKKSRKQRIILPPR